MVFYDVSEKRRAEKDLQRSVAEARQQMREIEAIYQSAPVGLCVFDRDLRYLRINQRLAEINGVPVEAHIGRTVREIVPALAETAEKLARHILSTSEPVLNAEFIGETPSQPGVVRSFNEKWLPITDENGQVTGISVVADEVTERKQMIDQLRTAHEALNRANAKLEQRVQERTARLRETISDLEQFSYSISHDMRAPLRTMNSFSTFLLEEYQERLDATAQNYLRRIVSAAQRLDDLIRDVLTYSQVAKAELTLGPVNLDAMVSDVLEEYPHLCSNRCGIEVLGPLATVAGSPPLVSQCVSNLLSNGVKFVTPGATPKVRVWTQENDGWVRFCVQDNGIGIDPAQMKKLWQIFQRGHSEAEYPGTGIGLSVVKRAVERMGGTVGVESEPGKGSTFWFQLAKASS